MHFLKRSLWESIVSVNVIQYNLIKSLRPFVLVRRENFEKALPEPLLTRKHYAGKVLSATLPRLVESLTRHKGKKRVVVLWEEHLVLRKVCPTVLVSDNYSYCRKLYKLQLHVTAHTSSNHEALEKLHFCSKV